MAHGALRGDERRVGRRHARGNQAEAARARRKKSRREAEERIIRIRSRHLRAPDRSALRRGAALGGCDYRSRAHARCVDLGARSCRPESGDSRIQNRSPSDVKVSLRSRFLLLGSALAPIPVAIVCFQFWQSKRVAQEAGGVVLDFHPAYLFTAMFLVGIACFVGALISLLSDSIRAKRTK